jgi:hypothetical protein
MNWSQPLTASKIGHYIPFTRHGPLRGNPSEDACLESGDNPVRQVKHEQNRLGDAAEGWDSKVVIEGSKVLERDRGSCVHLCDYRVPQIKGST